MMISTILLSILLGVFVLFALDYMKNMYKTELLLEQLFDQFLRLETRATYVEQEMYQALGDTMSKALFTSNALIYIRAREKFLLKHQAMPHKNWGRLMRHNLTIQEDPSLLGRQIGNGVLSEGYYTAYFRKKSFDTIVLPIKGNNNKILGFIVFFYFNKLSYLRAFKYLKLNASKLHGFLKHLFIVMREYSMDFKNITINQIKDYAIITTDANYHITYANNGALFLLGEPSEASLRGKTFLSYVDNQSLDQFHKILGIIQTLGETKTSLHLSSHHLNQAQTQTIHVQTYLKAITLEDEFMGLYILLHDTTNEEVMNKNMKRFFAIANSLFNHSDDAILQIATDGRITQSNRMMDRLCQTETDLRGQYFLSLFPETLHNKFTQLLEETRITKGVKEHFEVEINEKWYNVRTFPVFVGDVYDSSIVSFVDITTTKLHEQKLATINKQMLNDLNTARTLQYELLPDLMPSSEIVCYQHVFQPCEEFGGDFYYVEEITIEDKVYHLILTADVAGHGISAAMLTVLVKDVYTIFRKFTATSHEILPHRFLEMLNERLINLEMSTMPFVSVFMGILCPETREFSFSSGGIPFAVRIDPHHQISFLGLEKSPPTGFQEGFPYQYQTLTLQKGDRIIIYTDGIEELLSFSNTYFNNLIAENRRKTITEIKDIFNQKIEDFYAHQSHAHYHQDDITIILFELLP